MLKSHNSYFGMSIIHENCIIDFFSGHMPHNIQDWMIETSLIICI